MKYSITISYLKYLICIGSCFLFIGNGSDLMAQGGAVGAIKTKVKSKGRRVVYKNIGKAKAAAKIRVKGTKRALKSSLKGGGGFDPTSNEPTLDDLIDNPEAKASISDNSNKKRYVELLGEWTQMPSDAELLRRKIQDSLNRIKLNRPYEIVPKTVWDDDERPMMIFGWHPHWMGEMYRSYNYDLLNVVSYYSYDINPDNGAPHNSAVMSGFMQSEFVSLAHEKQCAALLSITCHGEENVMRFLDNNLSAQQRLLDSILFILDSTNADGIEINFEGVNSAVKDEFVKFVRVLSSSVTGARGDTSFVFLSVPAYDEENVYDLALLDDFVDIFIVKGFEFYKTPEGLKKMPAAPLNYSNLTTTVDLRTSVEKYIANLGPVYSSRLVLALPYFGTRWITDPIKEEVLEMNEITYSDIQFDFVMQQGDRYKYPGAMLKYDSAKTTYVFSYYDYYGIDTTKGELPNEVTIYYDDSLSLTKKYRYLIESRLGGVGIQFLGNDSGFDHLEDVLYTEFTDKVPVDLSYATEALDKSNYFRTNSIYLLAVLMYLSIFIAIGFCAALLNKKTRQALFVNKRFRLLYMAFFTLLILILGGYLGLFGGATYPLLFGILFGAILSWIGWKILSNKKSLTP